MFFRTIRRLFSPPHSESRPPSDRLDCEVLEGRTLPAVTLFAAGKTGGSPPGNVELWGTDGTTAGTKLVLDIRAGGASSDPLDLTYIAAMNRWFFTADDGTHGRELWVSDGTVGGTKLVKDVYAGISSGMDRNFAPFFTYCNGYVYFQANGGPAKGGIELWRTNGTASGTKLVADIKHREEGSVPAKLTAAGGKLFFVADDGFTQRELWVTDGTAAGTHLVKDIYPGNVSSTPERLTNVGGRLFFVASDPDYGAELWTSDGTEAGTRMVKDINPAPGGGTSNAYSSDPRWLVKFHNKLYFAADDGEHGRELWTSDGTEQGTFMVKDVVPPYFDPDFDQTFNYGSNPANLTAMNGVLYFSTLETGPTPGSVLYKSDGTEQGTVALKRINDAAVDSEEPYAVHLEPMRFTVVGTQLFFIAGTHQDLVSATNENVELWRTDGTANGTYQVKDIFPFNNGSSKPSKLREVNGKLVFFAYTEDYGREPWVSDGTAAHTFMLKDIHKDLNPGTTLGQDSESFGRSFGSYQYE